MRVCVRACVRMCVSVRARVRACVCVRARARVCVCSFLLFLVVLLFFFFLFFFLVLLLFLLSSKLKEQVAGWTFTRVHGLSKADHSQLSTILVCFRVLKFSPDVAEVAKTMCDLWGEGVFRRPIGIH